MKSNSFKMRWICLMVAWVLGAELGSAQAPAAGQGSPTGPQDAAYHGGLVTPPLPKPAFTLTDTAGAAFDFRSGTDGYVTLLYFGFCHCQTACPMQMNYLASALRSVPQDVRGKIKVVFVTTDPERDNPRMVRTWLNRFDRSFIGLTGTMAEIQNAETAAKLPRTIKPDEHAAFVVAYTRDNLGHVIYPAGMTQADWIHDLPRLVSETWTTARLSQPQQ
jgi:protein SCO1/2